MSKIWGSRREVLAVAGLALMADPARAATQSRPARPKDVGRKFLPDGRVRGFAGNTIICHLPQQGPGYAVFDRLLDIYRDLPTLRFARKVTALPTSSYHMTIFGGANDQGRETQPWPTGVPLDAPIESVNTELARRLAGIRLGVELPFRMVVDDRLPVDRVSPITLPLRPADEREAAKLKQARDRLAEALGMHAPDHDRYRFHITIGYQIEWFTAAEEAEYARALDGWRSHLIGQGVVFDFGAPEYCVFDDMFAFRRQFELQS